MTTMAMIYGLLPRWLFETCSSALLTHFGPKTRSSNWARRVHQVYPGSWNKSFKAACTEKYDGWLSTVEIHEETAAGNLRAPPGITILQWTLDFSAELPTEVIKKSLSRCALNPANGWQGDMIHCHKEGQPCSSGRSLLRSRFQSEILSEPDSNVRAAVLMSKKHIPDMTSFGLGSWRG